MCRVYLGRVYCHLGETKAWQGIRIRQEYNSQRPGRGIRLKNTNALDLGSNAIFFVRTAVYAFTQLLPFGLA